MSFPTFEAFFKAVHGHDPYQWQSRLAAELGAVLWPATIAAPTGAGKTCVIDIAVWHLASEAARLASTRGSPRQAPMRIVFAVNRRIVVDQAFDRAKAIATSLASAHDDTLLAVREVLCGLSGDPYKPLHVEQLRGGLPREDDWARSPSKPTVLCTTIDQLGSRLLFRGYGVSDRMAPIHAGLLGEDVLIIMDEAHLSDAFSQTLGSVGRWRAEREIDLGLPWAVCRLTATPRADEQVFLLDARERDEPGIAKRVGALKRAKLQACAAEGPELATIFAKEARDLARNCGRENPVVAVIVNRVALARAILDALKQGPHEEGGEDYVLLTGRSRPVDRDALIAQYKDSLEGRRAHGGTLYVVATQCIEAGADFDFDAMVTQIAPLDALTQRFGRLARSGNRAGGEAANAVILALKDDIAARTDDPIYGDRMKKTWDFLLSHVSESGRGKNKAQIIEMGPTAIDQLRLQEGAGDCMSEHKPAPFLRQADCDFFSITSPRPDPEPELTLFLHGEITKESDVNIVWRADLTEPDFYKDNVVEPRAPAIVEAMPPLPGEALAVPIWAARAWLREQPSDAGGVGDARGRTQSEQAEGGRRFVVNRRGEWLADRSSALRPGDTIVVPAAYGGCDRFGWAPESTAEVTDVADLAAKPYLDKRIRARLHPRLLANLADSHKQRLPDEAMANWPSWQTIAANLPDEGARSSKVAAERLAPAIPGEMANAHPLVEAIRALANRKRTARPEFPYGENPSSGCVLVAGFETVSTGDDRDAASFTVPEPLSQHRVSVSAKARQFGGLLPEALCITLEWAGLLHDDGKADERFQAFLRSFAGDALPGEILAKSGAAGGKRRGAWHSAGFLEKQSWRHEVLSVQMAIERLSKLPLTVDQELVLWLIGTHHGQGRPFFRHEDPRDGHKRHVGAGEIVIELSGEPGPHRLSFEWNGLDWATLFVRLKQRYGIWGLAYLEAALRLADHRASEASAVCAAETA